MPIVSDAPRINFQRRYINEITPAMRNGIPNILNIGCSGDPIEMGELALHVDIDDWSYLHRYFHQADAHALPEKWSDKFDLVILGDILEHVLDPMKVTEEAMRVTALNGHLMMTVFEEWRMPGPGQWIEESHAISDAENVKIGYKDREDFQCLNYPRRIGVPDDDKTPHLCHINQFTDEEMNDMVRWVVRKGTFLLIEGTKHFEQRYEEHDCYNWLFAFRRLTEE